MGRVAAMAQADRQYASTIASERFTLRSIVDLLHQQAHLTPEAIAVTFEDCDFTYAQVFAAADPVSRKVLGSLAGPETLVGLCVPRDFEMIAGVIGILQAGAAYLPLDPDLPAARIRQIVEEARPSLIVTCASQAPGLKDIGIPLLRMAEAGAVTEPTSAIGFALPEIDPESLAYVLYTSGSTGRPKGVEVTHGSVVNVLASYRQSPGMDVRDVVLALARISFDVSVLEILLPLSCGARVVLLAQRATRDPFALAQVIEQEGVTVVQGPPALWQGLLETGWKGNARLRIWSGGEALSRALADRLLPLCQELWNAYGPTETTIVSMLHRVSRSAGDVPIGRPIANTTFRVVDAAMRPVPTGQDGELCIGGLGLARGYRGRPDLTSERFHSAPGGTRLYRTGDVVRLDPAGELHFVGRTDGQVKLRGFRVEVAEVEAVLATYPSVTACAVRAWPDAAGQNALVAYVVLQSEVETDATAMRTFLRARLPDYMVPQRVIELKRFVLTPNAKIDRAALLNPFEADATPPAACASLVGASTQDRLGAIWRSLLGPVDLDPECDFFDLGGYSMLTVRLLHEIGRQFGRSVSIAELLSHSTLGSMAALIDGVSGGSMSRRLSPIQRAGSRAPLYWVDAGPLLRKALSSVGGDTPVYGFNLSPEDEDALLKTGLDIPRLASVVAGLLAELVDRRRPFCLGGWCRWGIVAYEAARQMREQGYRIQAVVLLDAHLRVRSPPWRGWKARSLRWVAAALPSSADRLQDAAPRRETFSDAVGRSAADYKACVYRGAVAHIQPMGKAGAARVMSDWRAVSQGPLTFHRSPGDHLTMVREPHCKTLGSFIQAAMSEAGEP